MPKISRRKLAHYAVTRLQNGDASKTVMQELAAYLIESKRTRELDLIIRDIESAFAEGGLVLADITSARTLADDAKREISAYVKKNSQAQTVELHEIIDERVIGGVKIEFPGHQFDGTIQKKLEILSR